MAGPPLSVHQNPAGPSAQLSEIHAAVGGAALHENRRVDRWCPWTVRADPGRTTMGHVRLDVPLLFQLARSHPLQPVARCGEDRARVGSCLYGDQVRLSSADHGCGLYGDDAGHVLGRDRFVPPDIKTEATAHRRWRRHRRTWTRGGGALSLGVPAGRNLTEHCFHRRHDESCDESGRQPESADAIRRLLCAGRWIGSAESSRSGLCVWAMALAESVIWSSWCSSRNCI